MQKLNSINVLIKLRNLQKKKLNDRHIYSVYYRCTGRLLRKVQGQGLRGATSPIRQEGNTVRN